MNNLYLRTYEACHLIHVLGINHKPVMNVASMVLTFSRKKKSTPSEFEHSMGV